MTTPAPDEIPWSDEDRPDIGRRVRSGSSGQHLELDPLDHWRLCDELTIIQAALLIAGEDPSAIAGYVERWDPEKRPKAYEPAKQALTRGLVSGSVRGEIVYEIEQTEWSTRETDCVDVARSFVEVDSVKDWLAQRGFNRGFFFPDPADAPEYLDEANPRYAPKLAAAVAAWQALQDPADLNGKSAKQALQKWIREHASEFGLTDDDGKPYEQGVEDVAKVANWQLTGGAPKTPG